MKMQKLYTLIPFFLIIWNCSSLQEKLNQKAPNAVFLVHSEKKENWENEKKSLPYFRLWN